MIRLPGIFVALIWLSVGAGCGSTTNSPTAGGDSPSANDVDTGNGADASDDAATATRVASLGPADGTSSFIGPPFVHFNSTADLTGELSGLQARIHLLRGDTREAVSFAFVVEHVEGAARGVVLYLNPATPLDGQYILHVDRLPDGYEWTSSTKAEHLDDGGVEARFSTRSEPRLREVGVCAKEEALRIVFGFSEKVTATAADFEVGYAGGGAPTCTWAETTAPANEYSFTCTELDLSRKVHVAVRAGLTSESGVAVPATEQNILFSAIALDADACRAQRL